MPAWQVSLWVQALPSLHAAPSALVGLLQTPVAGAQVPAAWHWSCALQVTGLAPLHVPVWQVSLWVQALPSLQAEPSALLGLLQVPLAGSQVPAVWHWSCALQVTGLAPLHVPAWHVSDCVQALPSLQAAPSALFGLLHVPLAGSHVPGTWHWSMASQMTGFEPLQVPAWHVSESVQASPSLQLAPSALLGLLQTPVAGAHVPALWHWSCAVQVTGLAPAQVPA